MRRGFVTGGCWCLDRNKLLERWPEQDQSARVLSVQRLGGGSACNFAIDMRRLDPAMPVETIGLVGDDEDGRFLAAEAERWGIACAQLHVTSEAPTQSVDAYSARDTGRRTHIYEEGTAALIEPRHFDLAKTSGRILHLGLPGIHRLMDAPYAGETSGWVAVLRAAHAIGIRTNLELVTIDPAKLAALTMPCLPLLDTLVMNDFEVGALAGVATVQGDVTDEAACLTAARAIMANGAMQMMAVHYKMGALALARDGTMARKPSVAVPPSAIRGANGAGDAFAAGFLRVIHDDGPLEEALTLAHAAAAASLRDVTTTGTVPSRKECLALAQSWGWRTA